MNRFRNFMYGRYGFDQFTRALIICALVLSILMNLTRISWLILIAYLPFIYALFRVFSKDIQRRTQENMAYMRITGKLRNQFVHLKLYLVGTKTHKYYKCAHCKQMIRVPRGKGRISISCPKCRKEFIRRT